MQYSTVLKTTRACVPKMVLAGAAAVVETLLKTVFLGIMPRHQNFTLNKILKKNTGLSANWH